jgi:alpha-amylase
MFADIDHKHPEVRADLFSWIEWLPEQVKLGGLRLDALKHYSFTFLREFVIHIQKHVDPSWFLVGEYWRDDSEYLAKFIEFMDHRISLFDVQLVSNFSKVSMLQEKGDLRRVLDDCLALWKPERAVVSSKHISGTLPAQEYITANCADVRRQPRHCKSGLGVCL